MAKAAGLAGLEFIAPDDFYFSYFIDVSADTQLYKRRYSKTCYRTHEAIMPGTKVTIEFAIADHISKRDLKRLFRKMGKYIGLTQYGFNLGYGKFNLKHIDFIDEKEEQDEIDNNGAEAPAV